MLFCPDASAVLAWLLEDQRTEVVEQFWTSIASEDLLVAPMLLLPECTSVLRRRTFDGVLSPSDAEELLGQMLELPIRISHNLDQFKRALEIATRTRRARAYDMQYVAVAELEGAEAVTLDGGIRQAAIELNLPVRLLR